MNMLALMYVAIGGAVGAMARYLVTETVERYNLSSFPFGTLTVNVVGGFLMGITLALLANMAPSKAKDLHLLFAVGLLGGFTTFSAFSFDVFLLLEGKLMVQAVLYVFGSIVLSVAALLAGMLIIRLAA